MKIKPGAELNRMVAERVFCLDIDEDGFVIVGKGFLGEWKGLPDNYSTDISDAWEVHKKACDFSFSKRQIYFETLREIGSEWVNFETGWPDVLMFLKDNMPYAICLAALEALGPLEQ